MSAPIISKRSVPNADGRHTLFLYFRHKGEKYREYLDIYVKPGEWDEKNRKFKGRSERATIQNNRLQKSLNRAREILWIYELKEINLTPQLFTAEFWNHASREDFIPFMKEEIQRQYNRRLITNYTKWDHLHIAEKIVAYCKALPYSQINRQWLEKFDAWHTKEQEKAGFEGARAREKALKAIRKYLKAAAGNGKEFTNPFEGFVWPKWTSTPTWLELNELKFLLKIYRSPLLLEERMAVYAREQQMRDFDIERYVAPDSVEKMRQKIRAFLIQCFTGARYSDLIQLRWDKHVNDNVLVFTPEKTRTTSGKTSTVPLTDMILELFLDGQDEIPKKGLIVRVPSNQKYNKSLKVVGKLGKIDKEITSHVGRHTFGSTMAANGVSVVSLMEMMGVTKISTVMIYVHSSLEQQAREIKRAQAGFLGSID